MKAIHYYDCADEQLLRSKEEEEQIRAAAKRRSVNRFTRPSSHELLLKVFPEDFSLPYPILLNLRFQGQTVVEADAEIGWQHQGIEKSLEHATLIEGQKLIARISPGPFSPLATAYLLALEEMMPLQVKNPFRQYLRLVGIEADGILRNWKIISRVVRLLSAYPNSLALNDIEKRIEALIETLQNGVFHKSTSLLAIESLSSLKLGFLSVLGSLYENVHLQRCLEGKAKVTAKTAINAGLSGIYVRGSGVVSDVRINHPTLPYSELGFQPQCLSGGDALSRFLLRIMEIENSLSLIDKALKLCLEQAPTAGGDSYLEPELVEICPLPFQTSVSFLEGAEGEFGVSICSNGTKYPHRVRLKTPSFSLTSAISAFLVGSHIEEVGLILNTIGINTLENDR